MRFLAVVLLCFLAVQVSLQVGTLRVNNIEGNAPDNSVTIESVKIDDTTVFVDDVSGLTNKQVKVSGVTFNEGDVTVPGELQVDEDLSITGSLKANGGIVADGFTVEDNTGILTLTGELRANGGINVDSGKFLVQDGTGQVTIASALLRPNGGIEVNNGVFTVAADDGTIKTTSTVTVEQNIIGGTSAATDFSIDRQTAASTVGGTTTVSGQSALNQGGDLILEPGYATVTTNHGKIIVGRAVADDITIGRADVSATNTNGGQTTFAGQSSTTGNGGHLRLQAGDSDDATQNGGHVYIIPGLSSDAGTSGRIILGTDDANRASHDLTVSRPAASAGIAGSTTSFLGQDSNGGRGGDLLVRAGDSTNQNGGDLFLEPGYSTAVSNHGKIFFGRANNDAIEITRVPTTGADDGGSTTYQAQNSFAGNGGDLFLQAGNAGNGGVAGVNSNGGDVHIVPGKANEGGTPGIIIVGQSTQDLTIQRDVNPSAASAGTSTSFWGQDSTTGSGGDFNVFAGSGDSTGGILNLSGGASTTGAGGAVNIAAGVSGGAVTGAQVTISAGASQIAAGGNVAVTGGASTGGNGGNVILSAGAGKTATSQGSVIVQQAKQLLINQVGVKIVDGTLTLENTNNPAGTNKVVISADPDAVVTVNGKVILKERQGNVFAQLKGVTNFPATLNGHAEMLSELQKSLNSLIGALGPCGHGLISVYDDAGTEVTAAQLCVVPRPIPRLFVNKAPGGGDEFANSITNFAKGNGVGFPE